MMKKIRFILVAVIIYLLFVSCKSKKVISDTIKIDTIYKEKIIKVTPSRLSNLVVESPCDSLGKLKPFFYTLGIGNDKITVKTIDNTISVEQNLDSIKEVWQNEYKSSFESKEKVIIKEVKRPFNYYLLIYSILSTIWIFKTPLLRLIKPF